MIRSSLFALLVVLFSLARPAVAQPGAFLLIDSDPDDPVGAGAQQTLLVSNAATLSGGNPGVQVQAPVTGSALGWLLEFREPGTQFIAGDFEDVANLPGAELRPLAPTGVGCQGGSAKVDLWFRVLEVSIDNTGRPSQLAIDFREHCPGVTGSLYGAIRINSDIPLSLAAPRALPGPPQQVFGGSSAVLDGTNSFVRPAAPLVYEWTQVAGPTARLTGAGYPRATFTAPIISQPGGAVLTFQLQITDPSGASATQTVPITVPGSGDPQNVVLLTPQPGEAITQGEWYEMDPGNTAVTTSTQTTTQYSPPQNFVRVGLSGDFTWSLGVAPPPGDPLAPGAYQNATPRINSGPSLDLSGHGAGCNGVSSFDLIDVAVDPSGTLSRFAASVNQQCTSAALLAFFCLPCTSLDFPVANAGDAGSAVSGQTFYLDASLSTDPHGRTLSYRWKQIAGPASSFTGPDSSVVAAVRAPSVTQPRNLVFAVAVTAPDGSQGLAQTSVEVSPGSGGGGGGGDPVTLAGLLLVCCISLHPRSRRWFRGASTE